MLTGGRKISRTHNVRAYAQIEMKTFEPSHQLGKHSSTKLAGFSPLCVFTQMVLRAAATSQGSLLTGADAFNQHSWSTAEQSPGDSLGHKRCPQPQEQRTASLAEGGLIPKPPLLISA